MALDGEITCKIEDGPVEIFDTIVETGFSAATAVSVLITYEDGTPLAGPFTSGLGAITQPTVNFWKLNLAHATVLAGAGSYRMSLLQDTIIVLNWTRTAGAGTTPPPRSYRVNPTAVISALYPGNEIHVSTDASPLSLGGVYEVGHGGPACKLSSWADIPTVKAARNTDQIKGFGEFNSIAAMTISSATITANPTLKMVPANAALIQLLGVKLVGVDTAVFNGGNSSFTGSMSYVGGTCLGHTQSGGSLTFANTRVGILATSVAGSTNVYNIKGTVIADPDGCVINCDGMNQNPLELDVVVNTGLARFINIPGGSSPQITIGGAGAVDFEIYAPTGTLLVEGALRILAAGVDWVEGDDIGGLVVTAYLTASEAHVLTDLPADLVIAHGAGSWAGATGFATATALAALSSDVDALALALAIVDAEVDTLITRLGADDMAILKGMALGNYVLDGGAGFANIIYVDGHAAAQRYRIFESATATTAATKGAADGADNELARVYISSTPVSGEAYPANVTGLLT
ncbi:MAG: hypothetical protein JKY94_16740 [Rhodobacteraceae bacterium]|nr:hypothetical protein [Paracoccaceae bacterium]